MERGEIGMQEGLDQGMKMIVGQMDHHRKLARRNRQRRQFRALHGQELEVDEEFITIEREALKKLRAERCAASLTVFSDDSQDEEMPGNVDSNGGDREELDDEDADQDEDDDLNEDVNLDEEDDTDEDEVNEEDGTSQQE